MSEVSTAAAGWRVTLATVHGLLLRDLRVVRLELGAFMLFGAGQSLLAGMVVLPLVAVVPAGEVALALEHPLTLVVAVQSALLSGALGLTLGTRVNPRQIGLMFSLVVLPLTFLGPCTTPGRPWTRCAGCRSWSC
ncbi:hypothetical protein [Egicoccus sp. AB-alg2]|uniref:hypothetical protein n=1 Tax=Egicoccus sp. AB-alg2 TaxID=3242693 RepID=UPI00359E7066